MTRASIEPRPWKWRVRSRPRVLGVEVATLAIGDRADLVTFDLPLDDAGLPTALRVRQTIVAGRIAHGDRG